MKKILTYISLILYFLSGTVYVIRYYKQYQFTMLLISIILILITHFSCVKYISIPKNSVDVSFILFALSIMISGFVNNEISTLFSSLGMFALWLAFSVWLPRDSYFERYYVNNVYSIILMPCVLIFIYSFIVFPISLVRYAGVFRTSNGIGDAAATACAVVLAKMINDFLEKNSKRHIRIDIIILLFFIFICMISSCRGAIITVITLCLISIFVIMRNIGKDNKKSTNLLIMLLISALLCFVLYKTTAIGNIVHGIILKFQDKTNNTLDGRNVRWDIVVSRIKVFGNGEKADLAAHNSFMSMLDQYGILSFIFLISYSVSALIKSIRIAKNSDVDGVLKFFPLMSCIGFIMLSMTESMMMKTIMLMVVFCFPLYRGKYLHKRGDVL